ncbi:MAG: META domain-containing protein [Bacteroidota bacterium]
MKFKHIIICITSILFLSCSTIKDNIFWISGFKTECSGVGKMNCLRVYKGADLSNPEWQHFYGGIEGFEFEEGYLKKIRAKEEQRDPAKVPADGSTIRYTLAKELEKRIDPQFILKGNWVLNRINDSPINRSNVLPELEIGLEKQLISGTGGCNSYSGPITKLTPEKIVFGNLISTEKACFNKHIEQDYFQTLKGVDSYQVTDTDLTFYDEEKREILSFIKKEEKGVNQRLHDIWVVLRINEKSLDRMSNAPRMEINLTESKILGNDSCNEYFASIKEVSDRELVFGPLGSTRKMCQEMGVADSFNQALNKVVAYKLEGLNLTLLDRDGNEVLYLLKVD